MKRSLTALIILELIIANLTLISLAVPINAQTQPEILLDPASYTGHQVGETFNIAAHVTNLEASQKVIGIQFRVKYDKNLLEALDVVEGPFLQQFHNTVAPYTYFIKYIENDPIFGPNVLVGILVLPDSNGVWTNFPYGSGTLATITFKVIYRPVEQTPATCSLTLADTMIVSETFEQITHTTQDATYQAWPIEKPTLKVEPITYHANIIGEVFEINVAIQNLNIDSKIIGIQFRVTYDAKVLQALDVVEGPFVQQFHNTVAPPYTYFIKYIENDPIFGPNVLVGILVLPDSNGVWTNFPYGSGTLATITFKAIKQTAAPQPAVSSMLTLTDILLPNIAFTGIPHEWQSGSYQIEPLWINSEPTPPVAGQVLTFTTLGDDHSVVYNWNFGDGQTMMSTQPTTNHIYASAGTYNIALTCIAGDLTSATVTKTITVQSNNQPTIDVRIDVGSMYFRGETAEFSILTANNGEPIDATKTEAFLYHGDVLYNDLTSSVHHIATGLYRIPYDVPQDAAVGTYTLIVKTEYYNAKGMNMKTFQISQMMTAQITEINNGIATIQTDLNTMKANLTAIDARLVSVEGNVATIETRIGTLQTDLQNINATVTAINGNVVTMSTTLGEVKTRIADAQSNTTTIWFTAAILIVVAVILGAVILMFASTRAVRKPNSTQPFSF